MDTDSKIKMLEVLITMIMVVVAWIIFKWFMNKIEYLGRVNEMSRRLEKFKKLSKNKRDRIAHLIVYGYDFHDASHGYDHILKVLDFLYEISGENAAVTLVTGCAIHDLAQFDSKYKDKKVFSDEELEELLLAFLSEEDVQNVIKCVTNMSWSKEQKGENEKMESLELTLMLFVIQMADWFTSIGKDGLIKSLTYNKYALRAEDPIKNVMELYESRLKLYSPKIASMVAEIKEKYQSELDEESVRGLDLITRIAHRLHEEMQLYLSREELEKFYLNI